MYGTSIRVLMGDTGTLDDSLSGGGECCGGLELCSSTQLRFYMSFES